MLEHLLNADPKEFLPAENVTPSALLDAQLRTALNDREAGLRLVSEAQVGVARDAFTTMTTTQDPDKQREALMKLEVPEAVKQLVGMLTAYDWAFVEQAKELRGYAVAKITEETVHPDAKIRLKALELLGKVTEVALFTERTEIKHTGMSDAELDEELKERLKKYLELKNEENEEKDVTPAPQ